MREEKRRVVRLYCVPIGAVGCGGGTTVFACAAESVLFSPVRVCACEVCSLIMVGVCVRAKCVACAVVHVHAHAQVCVHSHMCLCFYVSAFACVHLEVRQAQL